MKQHIDEEPAAYAEQTPGETAPPHTNGLGRSGYERDYLFLSEGADAFGGELNNLAWCADAEALVLQNAEFAGDVGAIYTSPVIVCEFPARQFLPSWNVKYGGGVGFRVYVKVIDERQAESPWFFIGEGGPWRKQDDEVVRDEDWGSVRIDYLELVRDAVAFQYRVEFIAPDGELVDASKVTAEIHRFFVHYSGLNKDNGAGNFPVGYGGKMIDLDVPYRSQLDVEREEVRDVVCCPTCVSMVLERCGVNRPTLEVCDMVYSERYDLFGIWPRASQAAFELGVKAWVDRFRSMEQVAASLEEGRPVIASIRVKKGDLRGARYPESNGHLVVLKGLTGDGMVIVNDPYSVGPDGAEIRYYVEDIEKCWLDCGGVAIMLE